MKVLSRIFPQKVKIKVLFYVSYYIHPSHIHALSEHSNIVVVALSNPLQWLTVSFMVAQKCNYIYG